MRAAVEDDAALRAEQVRVAGGLPARLGGRCARGHVLVAEAAIERRPESSSPAFRLDDPRPELKGRLVAHMLPVAAGELGDPVAASVPVITDDRAPHRIQSSPDGPAAKRPSVILF